MIPAIYPIAIPQTLTRLLRLLERHAPPSTPPAPLTYHPPLPCTISQDPRCTTVSVKKLSISRLFLNFHGLIWVQNGSK